VEHLHTPVPHDLLALRLDAGLVAAFDLGGDRLLTVSRNDSRKMASFRGMAITLRRGADR
jgi:hypothetical protein